MVMTKWDTPANEQKIFPFMPYLINNISEHFLSSEISVNNAISR